MDSRKPMTAGEIEEIKALEAKATPGPWAWEFTGDDNACAVGTVMDENDNFISGMVGQDADTIVVDSVCPEVSNQQDAAFIAAARNALPRLLSLLTQPPDAAVREAVEHLGSAVNSLRCNRRNEDGAVVTLSISDARTLLSAVQAPRGTERKIEALRYAAECLYGLSAGDDLRREWPEAFAGEVGRGE